jgi:hypothetical protein
MPNPLLSGSTRILLGRTSQSGHRIQKFILISTLLCQYPLYPHSCHLGHLRLHDVPPRLGHLLTQFGVNDQHDTAAASAHGRPSRCEVLPRHAREDEVVPVIPLVVIDNDEDWQESRRPAPTIQELSSMAWIEPLTWTAGGGIARA